MTIHHVETLSPKQLFSLCTFLSRDSDMKYVIEALELYFRDEIDEIDFSRVHTN